MIVNDEILADVVLWEVSQLEQKEWIKVVGDVVQAYDLLLYLQENGYKAELEPFGNYNQIKIKR